MFFGPVRPDKNTDHPWCLAWFRGGRVTLHNGLYGEAPPEWGTFFRLQVYERVEISLVELYERVEKSVKKKKIEKAQKGQLTDAFYGCEKVDKKEGYEVLNSVCERGTICQ